MFASKKMPNNAVTSEILIVLVVLAMVLPFNVLLVINDKISKIKLFDFQVLFGIFFGDKHQNVLRLSLPTEENDGLFHLRRKNDTNIVFYFLLHHFRIAQTLP